MAEKLNNVAFEWVTNELEEILRQARGALEAYVTDSNDSTKLRFTLTHCHQIHGTLSMVQLHNLAAMAQEMEAVAQALVNQATPNEHAALEVLMAALLQMSALLDRVNQVKSDIVDVALEPITAELQRVRGPALTPPLETKAANDVGSEAAFANRVSRAEFDQLMTKLSKMFRVAVLNVVRDTETDKNLTFLSQIGQRIHKISENSARESFWQQCSAIYEALLEGSLGVSTKLKQLLVEIDKEVGMLAETGPKALDGHAPAQLSGEIRQFLEPCDSQLPLLRELQDKWASELKTPQQLAQMGPDRDTMRSVVEALLEELGSIKDYLDLYLRSADRDDVELRQALPVFKRVIDTILVLGLGDALRMLKRQADTVENISSGNQAADSDTLMDVAESILSVEAMLKATVNQDGVEVASQSTEKDRQLAAAYQSVIREARIGIEQVREAIIEFIANQWDRGRLQKVPAILSEVRGALTVLPLDQAVAALSSCEWFICDALLASDRVPEWKMLDTLADSLTSVDYYLERLAEDSITESDTILDVAIESVAELGFPITNLDQWQRNPEFYQHVSDTEDDNLDISDFMVADEDDAGVEALTVVNETITPAVVEEELEIPAVSAEVPLVAVESGAEDVAEAPVEAAAEEEEEDLVDDEIIEIFIEEAAEVFETLDEFLPQLTQDLSDKDSLAEIRRAFHTLKGSGRMVGASQAGEFAWSIENMLNRVTEGSQTLNGAHVEVAMQARAIMPELITAFEKRSKVEPPLVGVLSAVADSSAEGEELTDAAAVQARLESQQPEAAAEEQTEPAAVEQDIVDEPVAEIPAVEEQEPVIEEPIAEEQLVASADDDVGIEEPFAADDAGDMDFVFDAADIELDASDFDAEVDPDYDAALLEIFTNEAQIHLGLIDGYVAEYLTSGKNDVSNDLQRALHTLKGSTQTANVDSIACFIMPLESCLKELREKNLPLGDTFVEVLDDAAGLARKGLDLLPETTADAIPGVKELLQRIEQLHEQIEQEALTAPAADEDADFGVFLAEGMESVAYAQQLLEDAQQGKSVSDSCVRAATVLRTLEQAAQQRQQDIVAQLAGLSAQTCEQAAIVERAPEEFFTLNTRSQNALNDMLDRLAAGQSAEPATDLIAELESIDFAQEQEAEPIADIDVAEIESDVIELADEDLIEVSMDVESDDDMADFELEDWMEAREASGAEDNVEEVSAAAGDGEDVEFVEALELDDEVDLSAAMEAEAELLAAATPGRDEISAYLGSQSVDNNHSADDDETSDEIIEIFTEEAVDILQGIDESVHAWMDEPKDKQYLDELLRLLHTLKGGARLADLTELGDISHDCETFLTDAQQKNRRITKKFFKELQAYVDQITSNVDALRKGGAPSAEQQPMDNDTAPSSVPDSQPSRPDNVLPFNQPQVPSVSSPFPAGAAVASSMVGAMGGEANAAFLAEASKRGSQEVVRVPSQLLENLVNLAGETSISRARAEEQVSEFGFSLEEMQSTVERLQEKLRRLEMETEAQILFRQEQVEQEGLQGFDPLEMDRYSHLQTLSRSLMESASDLMDLKGTLNERARDMETLLLQQSRINTDLQEGLMQSRMVPFARVAPRLRRIVRQVSTELDKQVDFEMLNMEGEMDRSVLERMLPPLEHMLRNSVDHGIESEQQRRDAGKPAAGQITLGLVREGNEIVLVLEDDGAGINLERVRSKAIDAGLMDAEADLTPHEVLQFILESGFSTATEVTQISGRGVGLDVVHSEIKQLGGVMDIQSLEGHGTKFIIRLPFTVSVNRALMVSVAGDTYAIPLNTIEGIVRVSPFELEAYYQPDAPMFEYAGQPYMLRYIGSLLRVDAQPNIQPQGAPLPVILVRGADHSMAIQVDELHGSREIVVKSLGAQFGMVQGVSGATVLGDGRVVVILDMLALIRNDALHMHRDDFVIDHVVEEETNQALKIMVVDDSVTVRKVTSRFLERQGMDVIVARDGVEAMSMLQDERPDLMLLDIEMPRMDGFEVANQIRHDSELSDLPIIMITSRTGDKHRERAISIGVNNYLGKPYQELELLDAIADLLGRERLEQQG
ncbi:MAG: Hpt domain-containing protein [Pseudomonadales bacterium]